MKNILFLIILFPIYVFSQTDSIDCHKFYKEHESSSLESPVIDQLPEPIGGMDSLYKKLIYPIEVLKGDVQGKVYIKVIIDTLGNQTQYEYDALGRVTKVIEPNCDFTTTTYDVLGRVISTTDKNHNTTSYQYDLVGNLTEVNEPNGIVTTQ